MALAERYFGDPDALEIDLVLQIQDAVRTALRRKRWNQNDLAYHMGTQRQTVSRLLTRGTRSISRASELSEDDE